MLAFLLNIYYSVYKLWRVVDKLGFSVHIYTIIASIYGLVYNIIIKSKINAILKDFGVVFDLTSFLVICIIAKLVPEKREQLSVLHGAYASQLLR
jgi:hypothetical protein